jgi:signal transduction histidine kinase
MIPILDCPLATTEDVFHVCRRARDVAAGLGLDEPDQVRLASALSEIGREVVRSHSTSSVRFGADLGERPCLVVRLTGHLSPLGRGAAGRLLDGLTEFEADGEHVTELAKSIDKGPSSTYATVEALAAAMARLATSTPLDELRAQNSELLAAIDKLESREQALVSLNAELNETNAGVMAMYGELSSELEETNRGVVALYAEVERLNEERSRFLYNASHELRTPVNAMVALCDLLVEDEAEGSPEERGYRTRLIRRSAGELSDLVNGLLELARAESPQLRPTLGPVMLDTVLADIRESLAPLAREGAVELVTDPVPGDAVASTDRTLLVRILRNLVGNALKFTEEGSVRVSARRVGATVEISVVDTGVGIAPEHQRRVFEEFFQVPGALQASRVGSGLGLPYALRLARTLGGEIDLDSEVGHGSRFTVRLPAHESSVPGAPPASFASLRVLVVDDDETTLHSVASMLAPLVGEVRLAGGAETALAMLEASPSEVVLVDVMMPGVAGFELAGAITSDPRWHDVRVVLMSAASLEGLPPIGGVVARWPKSALSRAFLGGAIAELVGGR